MEDEAETLRDRNEIDDAIVDGVLHIASNPSCKTCKANVDIVGDNIGKCTRCLMSQRLDKCPPPPTLSVKLLICGGDKFITLYAYLPMIQRIIKDDSLIDNADDLDAITAKLLNAGKFNLAYTANKVINAVYRQ